MESPKPNDQPKTAKRLRDERQWVFWVKMFCMIGAFCLPTFSVGFAYLLRTEQRLTSVETKIDLMISGQAKQRPAFDAKHLARGKAVGDDDE